MNYYLSKYIGQYRIKAEIDQQTNDFCRDYNGELFNNLDIYIKCANGIKIFHYGGKILEVYIPSIMRGRNILRQYCYDNNIGNITCENKEVLNKNQEIIIRKIYKHECSFEKLIEIINQNGIIYNINESDSEVTFFINDKNLDKVINYLNPQTSGASISPFSPKNLKKEKYVYTPTQISSYNEITNIIPKEDKLIIGRLNNDFMDNILSKKLRLKVSDIKTDMKKEQLKLKDYIYFKGYEKEYLDYLKLNIPLKLKKKED